MKERPPPAARKARIDGLGPTPGRVHQIFRGYPDISKSRGRREVTWEEAVAFHGYRSVARKPCLPSIFLESRRCAPTRREERPRRWSRASRAVTATTCPPSTGSMATERCGHRLPTRCLAGHSIRTRRAQGGESTRSAHASSKSSLRTVPAASVSRPQASPAATSSKTTCRASSRARIRGMWSRSGTRCGVQRSTTGARVCPCRPSPPSTSRSGTCWASCATNPCGRCSEA